MTKTDEAARAQPPAGEAMCRFCKGRGWEDDQNWSPRYSDLEQDRVEGDGLIRCGWCLGDGIDPSPHTADTAAPDGGERERVARAIASGFYNGNQGYDDGNDMMQLSFDMAADAVLALRPAEGLGRLRAEGHGSSAAPIPTGSSSLAVADLQTVTAWLSGLSECPDLNDVCADGGVTVGMVYQQEAREMSGRLARILSLPAASEQAVAGEWQPIDTAPKDGTEIVGHDQATGTSHVTAADQWGRWIDPDQHYYSEAPPFIPTLWMPLPVAPCITAADESSVGTKRSEVDQNPQGKGAEG